MKFLIAIVLACIWTLVAMCSWSQWKVSELRKQAIERGHAEYVVDSDGKTTWQWKEREQ